MSGWDGLVTVMRYLEARGVRQVLASALPDGRTSPNQIPVVDLVLAFLAETLARLPSDFRLYAVRADSGFFLSEFLEELERRALPYVIAVQMNPLLRRAVAAVRQWQLFDPGLEAGETTYCAHGWSAPRRLVVVRELLDERPKARGRKLLEVPDYTFHVLVTTLSHDLVHTWRFYNSRAESENRIKELKEDFGADGFCL